MKMAALLLLAVPVLAVEPPTTAITAAVDPAHQIQDPNKRALDTQILSELHHTNQMEIQAGEMALQRSQNADVRDFAGQLVQDHQAADSKVIQMANQQGVTLTMPEPTTEDGRRALEEHQASLSQLASLQGNDFDRNFLKAMVEGHRYAISDLTAAEGKSSQAERDLISQVLPAIRDHRRIASNLLKALPEA